MKLDKIDSLRKPYRKDLGGEMTCAISPHTEQPISKKLRAWYTDCIFAAILAMFVHIITSHREVWASDTAVNGTIVRSRLLSISVGAKCSERCESQLREVLEAVTVRSISYVSDGLEVEGFLIEPRRGVDLPAIIYNRGGYGRFGALGINRELVALLELSARGYVIAASQYRGTNGAPGHDLFGGDDVSDVMSLLDLLKARPRVDGTRLGMMGHSRGGMMTYIALTRTAEIKAAAVIAGPTDLGRLARQRLEMLDLFKEVITTDEEKLAKELDLRSALKWPEKIAEDTPLFILHGTKDWRVHPGQSTDLARRLKSLGREVRLQLYDGDDHALSSHHREAWAEIADWFDAYL